MLENVQIKYRNYMSLWLSTVRNLLNFISSPLSLSIWRSHFREWERLFRGWILIKLTINFELRRTQGPFYLSVLPEVCGGDVITLRTEGKGVAQWAGISVKEREELPAGGGGWCSHWQDQAEAQGLPELNHLGCKQEEFDCEVMSNESLSLAGEMIARLDRPHPASTRNHNHWYTTSISIIIILFQWGPTSTKHHRLL